MHKSSLQNMSAVIGRVFADSAEAGKRTVLDVGSSSLNGAYRPLFCNDNWAYTGLDICMGPNVDVVAEDPYNWPIMNGQFDLVVSGQTIEHVEFFWLSMLEIRRVLKPGGFLFLVAPSRGPQHRHPVDCWRFYPDGFAALAKWAGMELLWVNNPWKIDETLDFQSMWEWGDCVGVFRSPQEAGFESLAALQRTAREYLRTIPTQPAEIKWQHVKTPRARESYLSTKSMLRFRLKKHFGDGS